MKIEVNYQPTYEDVRKGRRLRLGQTKQKDRIYLILYIIISLGIVFFFIYKIFSTNDYFYQVACWSSIGASILILFLVLVHSENIFKEQFEQEKIFYENYKIIADDDNITISSKYSTNIIPWIMINKVRENKSSILFFYSKQWAINIPKRILPKPDENEIRTKINALKMPYQFIDSE